MLPVLMRTRMFSTLRSTSWNLFTLPPLSGWLRAVHLLQFLLRSSIVTSAEEQYGHRPFAFRRAMSLVAVLKDDMRMLSFLSLCTR